MISLKSRINLKLVKSMNKKKKIPCGHRSPRGIKTVAITTCTSIANHCFLVISFNRMDCMNYCLIGDNGCNRFLNFVKQRPILRNTNNLLVSHIFNPKTLALTASLCLDFDAEPEISFLEAGISMK